MKSLYAPARLNDALRLNDWKAETTVSESAWKTINPQAADIAARAMSQISRQKSNGLRHFGAAHKQIVENEISDCMRLHMAGLTWPPRYVYTISLVKRGDWITATVKSQPA